MRRSFILLLTVFLIQLAAEAMPNELDYDFTALSKHFLTNTYPQKKVEAKVGIFTRKYIESLSEQNDVIRSWDLHKKFRDAFFQRGWTSCEPWSDILDVGSIEVVQEERLNIKMKEKVVIRTYLYVCESDKLWNMRKYRGGSLQKYVDGIVKKAEECVKENHNFK